METTIQVSKKLADKLKEIKISEKESYETVIWDLIEDSMELSEEAKKKIAVAEREIKKGKVHDWEDVKRELKINVRNNTF